MNLHRLLQEREAAGTPVRVALIGAGKFGSMFLSQAPRTPGHARCAASPTSARARAAALARVGWPAGVCEATSLGEALSTPHHVHHRRRTSAHRRGQASTS